MDENGTANGSVRTGGKVTITDQAQINNNHADRMGDDLYSSTADSSKSYLILSVEARGQNWRLLDSTCTAKGDPKGDLITGWFHDGWRETGTETDTDQTRWNAHDVDLYYCQRYTLTSTDSTPMCVALKAAHNEIHKLTVNYVDENGTPLITPDESWQESNSPYSVTPEAPGVMKL